MWPTSWPSSTPAATSKTKLGPVDLWVNDAMTTAFAPTWQIEPADFQRAIEVTFLGQVWGTRVALDLMTLQEKYRRHRR